MSVRLSLDVRLDGYADPIGRLDALDGGEVEFRYAPAFLRDGRSISLSLPLDDAPVPDSLARAFFENLLPENDRVQRIIDREGLQEGDIVSVLAHVGADCAGAISCVPAGATPIKVPGELANDYRPLDDDEIATIVNRLADREPLPADIADPSPVAGVQSKIALTLLPDGSFALPRDGIKAPTTHILKVPRRRDAAEALQEDASTRLASACGFDVSHSHQVSIAGVEAVLIGRFDRVVIDDVVYRLHQEDFAQALGLPARMKYERHGGPDRRFDADAALGVLKRLAEPALATERFLLATIFNLAIGNNDNHAKNHAVLYDPYGRPSLAPLYDLLPVRLNPGYTDQLAFHIGDATHFDAMQPADLAALLAQFGLGKGGARRFVEGPVRTMLTIIEERSLGLRKIGLRFFDDLIGRELARLSDLFAFDLAIRERDAIDLTGGGWAMPS